MDLLKKKFFKTSNLILYLVICTEEMRQKEMVRTNQRQRKKTEKSGHRARNTQKGKRVSKKLMKRKNKDIEGFSRLYRMRFRIFP